MSNVNATTPAPPHSLEAPAPAQPARPGIDIVFPLRKRPGGSPGKEGFCMKEVFNLDGREYMMVLNSIREIAIACKLNMMKSFTRQNQNIVRRIYEKACDIFPGFRVFADQDNHQWPVEAFLMVILKSASDTRSAIQWTKACAKVATASPNTKARRKAARQESARRSALARSAAKRKAMEARVDTELGFQDAIEQVSQGLGDMSFKYDNEADQEMDYKHGPDFGGAFLDHVPLSTHEPAQPSSPVPTPVRMPVVPPYVPLVPSATVLAHQPPPIPSAATRPRPCQAEDSLDSAAMSAPTSTSALTAPTATSALVGPANIIPAPLAALARPPPPIPPAASHPRPRPRPRQANRASDLVPVPTPTPAPTLVPTPTPAPTPAPSPTSSPVPPSAPSVSAPDGLTHAVPALVPVATSTPVRARTSAPASAALTTAPLAIHARVSNLLLSQSLGTPEVNRTLFDMDDDDFNLTIEALVVVAKGKGKAKGGPCTKAKAGAETPEAEPSTSAQPAARAPHRKKVVELPPTAPAARTRSKKAV